MNKLHHLNKKQYIWNVLALYLESIVHLNMGHIYYPPITKQIVLNSISLLLSLPSSSHLDNISVGIEDDGDLTIMWAIDSLNVMSLSISNDATYYAVLIDDECFAKGSSLVSADRTLPIILYLVSVLFKDT